MSDLSTNIKVEMGSDRAFGLVFTTVAATLTVWGIWNDWFVAWAAAASTAVLLIVTLVRPALLNRANRFWFRFGNILHAIISPLVMLMIYLIAFLPIGLIFTLIQRDPLARRFDRTAGSYWIRRETQPGPMEHQF